MNECLSICQERDKISIEKSLTTSIFLPILEYSEALSRIDFSKSDRRTQAWCAKAFSVQGSQDIQILSEY